MTEAEMRDPVTSAAIARELRRFHELATGCPNFGPKPSINEAIKAFIDNVRDVLDVLKDKAPEHWNKDHTNRAECTWVQTMIDNLPRVLDEIETEACSVQHTVVFGHSDLQPGNILLKDGHLCLIDFDYAGWTTRGYDIANHICEWAADYHGPTPHHMDYGRLPTEAQRRHFVLAYLEESDDKKTAGVSEDEVDELIKEIEVSMQMSHVWWGVWGLLQATMSTIKFDYPGYAKCRLDMVARLSG